MTVEECLRWVHPSNPSKTQDLECARVLAYELQLTIAEMNTFRRKSENYRAALEMITGKRQCINNLLSDQDIAREALEI